MTTPWNMASPEGKAAAEAVFEALVLRDFVRSPSAAPTARVGFGDLYAFAASPAARMDARLASALISMPSLRRDLDALLDRISQYRFPRVAAASGGDTGGREGDGYAIRIKPSKAEPEQVYVLVTVADPAGRYPTALFFRTGDGRYGAIALPAFVGDTAQLLAEEGSELVRALRDVDAEVFLR